MELGEKLNLVPAIREIQCQIDCLNVAHKEKIKPYYDSLEALRKINTVCESCDGTGWISRLRSCAEDYRPDPKNNPDDRVTCPLCHGTGLSNYGKDKEE